MSARIINIFIKIFMFEEMVRVGKGSCQPGVKRGQGPVIVRVTVLFCAGSITPAPATAANL